MLRNPLLSSSLFGTGTLILSLGCTPHSEPMKTDSAIERPKDQHDSHSHAHDLAHGGSNSVQLIIGSTPHQPVAGEPVKLHMMLHDSQGKMLKEFELRHDKIAHLILIREGLDEFAHLHPSVDDDGNLRETHTFPKAGKYYVYLDYKAKGQTAETSQAELTIGGDPEPAEKLVPDATGLVRGVGLQAEVTMRNSNGASRIVSFQVQQDDQQPVQDLEKYLGAMGHLVVVSANGKDYVHAHPLTEHTTDGKVEFDVHFPRPGIYKLWGQFKRGGRVYTLPTILDIREQPEAMK
jgi:hypothetical protein